MVDYVLAIHAVFSMIFMHSSNKHLFQNKINKSNKTAEVPKTTLARQFLSPEGQTTNN